MEERIKGNEKQTKRNEKETKEKVKERNLNGMTATELE